MGVWDRMVDNVLWILLGLLVIGGVVSVGLDAVRRHREWIDEHREATPATRRRCGLRS
jgi:hypothetical protein